MRIAFVTPRYGAEIFTGPEHGCRLLAEQLSVRHDVEVVTTCARAVAGWPNEYAEGSDRVRGVLVRRFAATAPADRASLQQLSHRLFTTPHGRADELECVRRLGPWSPGLMDFLKRHHRNYEALVFFSYRHAITVQGLEIAPERSILFPWLRMEPSLRLGIARETLLAPAAVGYFSSTERQLLRARTRGAVSHEEVVGVGVHMPQQQRYPQMPYDNPDQDVEAGEPEEEWSRAHLTGRGVPFRRRHRLDGRIVLYGGRVEPDNGCEELIEYFDSFAAQDGVVSLVLMGVKLMKLPDEPYLRLAGVLPARERMAAFEAADVTAAPEPDQLTAETVLESFAVGTPVLASARNAAAVEHCRRANAGLYYRDRGEFVEALRVLITNDRLREMLGRNGRRYVSQNFSWDVVVGRFERLLARIKGGR